MTTCPFCSDPRSFSTLYEMDSLLSLLLDAVLCSHEFDCREEAMAFESHCQSKLRAAICAQHNDVYRWLEDNERCGG